MVNYQDAYSYVCVCTCVYACVHVRVAAHKCVHTCIHTCACVYIRTKVHTYTHACVHVTDRPWWLSVCKHAIFNSNHVGQTLLAPQAHAGNSPGHIHTNSKSKKSACATCAASVASCRGASHRFPTTKRGGQTSRAHTTKWRMKGATSSPSRRWLRERAGCGRKSKAL